MSENLITKSPDLEKFLHTTNYSTSISIWSTPGNSIPAAVTVEEAWHLTNPTPLLRMWSPQGWKSVSTCLTAARLMIVFFYNRPFSPWAERWLSVANWQFHGTTSWINCLSIVHSNGNARYLERWLHFARSFISIRFVILYTVSLLRFTLLLKLALVPN